jgi:hypothetical protein
MIRGTMNEDDLYFEAEVEVINGFPYIYNVDFYRNSDRTPCNVTDELAHKVHLLVKETFYYQIKQENYYE